MPAQRNANATSATGCNRMANGKCCTYAACGQRPASPLALTHPHTHTLGLCQRLCVPRDPKQFLFSPLPLYSYVSLSLALPYIINIIVVNVMRRDYDISLPCTRTRQREEATVGGGGLRKGSPTATDNTCLPTTATTADNNISNLFTIAMAKCWSSYASA